MAKDDKNKNEDIVKREERTMSIEGTFDPAEFERFIGDGFAQIETVLFGRPTEGKLPFYIGQLVGPSGTVDVGEEDEDGNKNKMPVWAFHPYGKLDQDAAGKPVYGVVSNVTHTVPSTYMVDAACKRIWERCQRTGEVATVGIYFIGKSDIPGKPRQMNRFKIFERYDAPKGQKG